MSMEGHTECAVRGCGGTLEGPNNLCAKHALPGMAVRVGNSTMVVTAWYAERKNEYGLILCNDFALGDLFGGAERFVARLAAQGFGNVRAMATPEELRPAMDPLAHVGKIEGAWSGPWQTEYPWMAQAQLVEHVLFGDETEKQTEEQ